MRLRSAFLVVVCVAAQPTIARAQNWSVDARAIALGGVGSAGNLATKMIDEQGPSRSIVLPLGLIQVFSSFETFDPSSKHFDPIRDVEFAASPLYYVVGRGASNSAEALFVSDIRNATLNRDLSRYMGFLPADDLVVEGLLAPSFGHTVSVLKNARGGFQGIYVGAGPYVSMHADGTVDSGLRRVFSSGVNVPNAQFPIANSNEGQLALAVTGGYRGRFAWAPGIGSGSEREGVYVALNVDYLRGFRYESIDTNIRLDTDNAGLIALQPLTTPIIIDRREASSGEGFALDFGLGAVIDRWEVGVGANGIANRITWQGLTETHYALGSLIAGSSTFTETGSVTHGDVRVELPVDYLVNVTYNEDRWSAAAEVGHGFGGGSFNGGVERRMHRVDLRGGVSYATQRWSPTGGIGLEMNRRASLDFAVFGTSANIERSRQMAFAASIRIHPTQ